MAKIKTKSRSRKKQAAIFQKYFKGDQASLATDLINNHGEALSTGDQVTIIDSYHGDCFFYLVEKTGTTTPAWVIETELKDS